MKTVWLNSNIAKPNAGDLIFINKIHIADETVGRLLNNFSAKNTFFIFVGDTRIYNPFAEAFYWDVITHEKLVRMYGVNIEWSLVSL